jgi:hypothetical protein
MARIAGKNANFSFNSVALEDELKSIDMNVDVDIIDVTASADAANEFVEGKYSSKFSVSGAVDPAASQGDATIFGQIGSGAAAILFDPTGSGPNTNAPTYGGSALVKSYKVKADVGGAVTYSAEFQVTGALTRDVTA